ncbi:ABC transporter substrate-binding protein [Roseixanthobacter pseudopolyaromaticivorans]|uniref:ABC transporter substrate-binding protein n=1 Tax=Xanthobacteraceae TaxID=335928 RepID=UPI003726769F
MTEKPHPATILSAPLPRRRVLQGLGAAALVGGVGMPAIVKAQADTITFGHLTPLTGFLGPLGAYGQMGVQLAVEEINAAGGVNGRKINLIMEDSVNPATASSKAERYIERDKAAVIIGEISSASCLAIAQVAARNKIVFVNTGGNSDALRGKDCNRYMFHVEGANTQYVKAVGAAMLRDGLIKGKKLFFLTADYAFGHDLSRVAKLYINANGGEVIADELVPTDASDFSAYMLKIRQMKPDVVISNLAGNQITNFIKQYAEFGLPFPFGGFGFDTAVAWGAGKGNFGGVWPCIWHHDVDAASSKAFVAAFVKKYGKPPENQAWGDYVATKTVARAMNETKSTDSAQIIGFFEKEPKLDILKGREGYYRAWDHQLIQEMYTITAKPVAQVKDQWDLMVLGKAVPAANDALDVIAPTPAENACSFPV